MKTNLFGTLDGADNVQVMDDGENLILKIKKSGDYGVTTNKAGKHNYAIVAHTRGIGFLKLDNGLEVSLFVGKRLTPTKAELKAAKSPTPASASAPVTGFEIDYDKLAAAMLKLNKSK